VCLLALTLYIWNSVLVLTVGAEIAVESGNVRGPGTFLGVLIDVLWKLTPEDVTKRAKINVHDL